MTHVQPRTEKDFNAQAKTVTVVQTVAMIKNKTNGVIQSRLLFF